MKRGWNNATACHSVRAWTRLAVPIMLLTFLLLHLYLINIPCSPTCYAVTLPAPLQPPHGNCGPYGTVRTWSSQAEYWFGADIDRICNTPLTSLAWTWCTLTPRACWYEYWFCSFTVLHQYVATYQWVSAMSGYIPDCLGWWMIQWLLLCFIKISILCRDVLSPTLSLCDSLLISLWFWSFSCLRMRCSGWYSLVLVFGALQMCVVLCHGVERNTADLTCVTPLQA